MALPSISSNQRHFSIPEGASVVAAPEEAVDFLLEGAREDMSGYRRSGSDLVIAFKDGRSLQITDFFSRGLDGHQLIAVQGEARWWVRLAPQTTGDGPMDAVFEAVDDDSSSYLLAILGGGLGVGALAGAGGSGSQRGGSTLSPPEPSSPPMRPVIDSVSVQRTASGEFLAGKETVEIQGHGAIANGRLSVLVDGRLAGTTQADANGQWTYILSGVPAGRHLISVTQTDAAGKTSEAADINLVVDATAPPTPQIESLSDDAGSIQGAIAPGGRTDDSTPTLSGTAQAGSTIRVFDGSTQIGQLVVGDAGQWQFKTPTLGDGLHMLSVTAIDAAGNESQPSKAFELTVDTIAPAIPTIDSINDGAMGDRVSFVTKETQPTLKGRAEPHSTVTIYNGDKLLDSVTAEGDGQWSYRPPAAWADAVYQLTVKASDAAGNESKSSEKVALTVDTTAPPTPQIDNVSDDAGSIQGAIAPHGRTDDSTPTLSGRAQAGSTIRVFDGSTQIGKLVVGDAGQWQFKTPTLGDGLHMLSVTATDAAGNESQPSKAFELTVDTIAPAIPTIDSINDGAMGDRVSFVTKETQPTLKGRAEPHSTVTIYNGDKLLDNVTADGDGQWSYRPPAALADAVYQLTVKASDAAGNESKSSEKVALTVDTTAPPTPQIDNVSDDAGFIQGAIAPHGRTDDSTPTLSGRAEAGSTVRVFDGSTQIGKLVVGDAGQWQFKTPTLGDGLHMLSVTATDAAGNESQPSKAFELTVDTIAPAIPTIDSINDGAMGDRDFLVTKETRPTLKGRAEAHSTVTIRIGDAEPVTLEADGNGQWSYRLEEALEDGNYALSVTATDAAGNASKPGAPFRLFIDTQAPPPPSIEGVRDNVGQRTGILATGESTDDNRPTLYGKAEANSIVTITGNGIETVTVTADDEGAWTFTPETPWDDGQYAVTVHATDAAGNTGASSSPRVFTVDTTQPDQPRNILAKNDIGQVTLNGQPVGDTTPTFSGSAEANSVVYIFLGEDSIGSVEVGPSGKWTWTPDSPLAEELHTLKFQAVDAAGNRSPASAFTLQVFEPMLTITSIIDAYGRPLFEGSSTSTFNSMRVSGISTAPSTSIHIQLQGVSYRTEVDENGKWTILISVVDEGFEEGRHRLWVSAHSADGSRTETYLNLNIDRTMAAALELDPTDGERLWGRADLAATAILGEGDGRGLANVTADADTARWSVTPDSRLSEGGILSAMAEDDLGKAGEACETSPAEAGIKAIPAPPETGEEPLMLAAPDQAPMNDALHPGAVGYALLPLQGGAVDGLGEPVDCGWLMPAPGGDRIELAQLLSNACAQTQAAKPGAEGAAMAETENLLPQAAVDNFASGQGIGRDAANLVFGADMRAPAADMGAELEKLLAQHALAVV